MAFELSGKLFLKEETNVISDKFKKREFVVLKEENNAGSIFTEYIKFQLVQDKCSLLDNVQLQDEVKVSFNIKGVKWEKNGNVSYFNNLDAWRIEQLSAGAASSTSSNEVPAFNGASASFDADDNGDLPF
jgi:hypothetical protein